MVSRHQSRRSARLATETGMAAASVVAMRSLMLANPLAWQQAGTAHEARRVVEEKLQAAASGAWDAGIELASLPWRVATAFARPDVLTPMGYLDACVRIAELGAGVANAAFAPAGRKAVANRKRLSRRAR